MLQPKRDPLGLQVTGAYKILCTCGSYYVGQTEWSVSVTWKELQSHLSLEHVDKSALATYGWAMGHSILFDQTEILYKLDQVSPRNTREVMELQLNAPCIEKMAQN